MRSNNQQTYSSKQLDRLALEEAEKNALIYAGWSIEVNDIFTYLIVKTFSKVDGRVIELRELL